MPLSRITTTGAALCLIGAMAFAHGTEDHSADGQAAPAPLDLSQAPTKLPWEVGGPFALTDHTGAARTQVDPDGKYQLLFFGYANCPGICSAALPMMADVAAELKNQGVDAVPILLTIDPALDTVETMGPALEKFSDDFVGLTGTPEELSVAYDAFQVEFEHIMDDPEYGPIYSHGSHIYLLNPAGEVLTLLPPILPAEQVTQIVAKYAQG